MNTLTGDIPHIAKLPSNMNMLGLSKAILEQQLQKENAALTLCGALLGDCYILMEVIDYMLTDLVPLLKKKPWYKHDVKKSFNNACDELSKSITNSISHSASDSDHMRNVADIAYDTIKDDIFKLKNAILFDLNKQYVKSAEDIADVCVIGILFDCIRYKYDSTIQRMKKVYNAYYDSWYNNARCDGPAFWWRRGTDLFAQRCMSQSIDLNNSKYVKDSVRAILNKLDSKKFNDTLADLSDNKKEADKAMTIVDNSMSILGLT